MATISFIPPWDQELSLYLISFQRQFQELFLALRNFAMHIKLQIDYKNTN